MVFCFLCGDCFCCFCCASNQVRRGCSGGAISYRRAKSTRMLHSECFHVRMAV